MTKKRVYQFAIGGLFIIYVILHIYQLGNIPYGINCDEMGMGYDSWCLANFGIDRYKNSFPVYLINFSGGQSVLYAYLCMPFVQIMGFSAWAFRMPIFIFSILTFIFMYKISGILWEDEFLWRFVTLGILTVCPVFIMLFRIGLDCNLMLGTITIMLYFIMKMTKYPRIKNFVFTGLIIGLTLYTYVLSHFAIPIFLLITCLYLLYLKKIDIKQLLAMWMPIIILAIPLILFQIINMFDLDEMHIGIITIPKLYRYRSDEISLSGIFENLKRFFEYTLIYDGINYNSIREYPSMYLISIPFIFIGLLHTIYNSFNNIKRKVYDNWSIILFWFCSMFITGIFLGEGGPIVYRMNAIYGTYLLFTVEGIRITFEWLKLKHVIIAKLFVKVVAFGYAVFFLFFVNYYFRQYTQDTYLLDYFNFTYADVLSYIEDHLDSEVANRTTYIGDVGFSYIYYLGSTGVTPFEYNDLADDQPYTLYLWMESYKNYRFNFPEEIDTTGNYIIPETSEEYINILRQYNFTQTHIGTYYLFTNPFLYNNEINSECVISYDHGINDKGQFIIENNEKSVLSGWAYDVSDGCVWDDIILNVNDQYYRAQITERQDVAEVVGNDDMIQCGFHFSIDTTILNDVKQIELICINYQSGARYSQKFQVEKN